MQRKLRKKIKKVWQKFHNQNKGIKECNRQTGYLTPALRPFHNQNKGIKECN